MSPSSLLLALDVSRLFGFLDPLGVAPTASAPAEVPAPTLPPTAPAVDSSSLTNGTRSGHKLNFFIVGGLQLRINVKSVKSARFAITLSRFASLIFDGVLGTKHLVS